MIKVLIILIIVMVMVNLTTILTIYKIKTDKRNRNKCIYKTPKLSSLNEKEFCKYIDNLTKDLY